MQYIIISYVGTITKHLIERGRIILDYVQLNLSL